MTNMNAYQRFHAACEAQHAVIFDTLDPVGGRLPYAMNTTTPLGGLVKAAAHRLNYKSEELLASQPLELEELPRDTPTQLLGRMINASFEPLPDEPYPHTRRDYSTCYRIEEVWNTTHNGMAGHADKRPLVQIFMEDDQPVLLRKGRGHPTGLTLRPFHMGRHQIEYPAGSVVQLDSVNDKRLLGNSTRLRFPRGDVIVSPHSDVQAMQFTRLSAYAVEPSRRNNFFDALETLYSQSVTLADMEQGALRQVERYHTFWRRLWRALPVKLV